MIKAYPKVLEEKPPQTTKWLASIKSLLEAQKLIGSPPTLVDLKNPAAGALGALETTEVADIVAWVQQSNLPSQTSATIGDLPMQADIIIPKLHAMAETGVDYLKIGLFPEAGLMQCLTDLSSTIKALETPVIGVLFADAYPDNINLSSLKQAGFHGAMVDTAIKNGKGLLDHWDEKQLSQFISDAHSNQLICGLAGVLKQDDVSTLQPLGADYLGFRSALCHANTRTDAIDVNRVREIKSYFK